jgi:tetratricopeptide (TPR) repeat protein
MNGSVVVYRSGQTASNLVSIVNDVVPVMNLSKIVVEFYQIGKNKTLDLSASPYQLQNGQTGIFTVSFTADGTEFISGIQFDYNLIFEWVNATTGPMKVVGYWEYARWWTGQPAFQVYPAAQADAIDSLSTYNAYYNTYGTWYWTSDLGRQKANQAIIEKNLGDTYSTRGDYTSALTQYNNANTLWEEALAAENDYRTKWNDADLNTTLGQNAVNMAQADAYKIQAEAALTEANAAVITANATKIQADAALTNAYGWYFIGAGFAIGWSLMGVGVVIYALRRPKNKMSA